MKDREICVQVYKQLQPFKHIPTGCFPGACTRRSWKVPLTGKRDSKDLVFLFLFILNIHRWRKAPRPALDCRCPVRLGRRVTPKNVTLQNTWARGVSRIAYITYFYLRTQYLYFDHKRCLGSTCIARFWSFRMRWKWCNYVSVLANVSNSLLANVLFSMAAHFNNPLSLCGAFSSLPKKLLLYCIYCLFSVCQCKKYIPDNTTLVEISALHNEYYWSIYIVRDEDVSCCISRIKVFDWLIDSKEKKKNQSFFLFLRGLITIPWKNEKSR